jgi:hypothetical protein
MTDTSTRPAPATPWIPQAVIAVELYAAVASLVGLIAADPYLGVPAFARTGARWLTVLPGTRYGVAGAMGAVGSGFLIIIGGCVVVARRDELTTRGRWLGLVATLVLAAVGIFGLYVMGDLIELSDPNPAFHRH